MFVALDIGSVRTGVAVSDRENIITTPHSIIHTGSASPAVLCDAVLDCIAEYDNLEGIVLGYPDETDVRASKICASVREVRRILEQSLEVPVFYQDEQFSSRRAADRVGKTRRKGKKILLDAMAAAVILEDFLEYTRKQR